MDAHLKTLLDELAAFGDAHDSDAADRASRMLNITPDTGEFLAVTTIELSAAKIAMARENFTRAGLADLIEQREGDAGAVLASLPDAGFDLLFLDSKRSDYLGWWPDLKRVLRPGGLLVVDNATSHAHEMADFTEIVRQDAGFTTSLAPVGKGEFLAVKG